MIDTRICNYLQQETHTRYRQLQNVFLFYIDSSSIYTCKFCFEETMWIKHELTYYTISNSIKHFMSRLYKIRFVLFSIDRKVYIFYEQIKNSRKYVINLRSEIRDGGKRPVRNKV